MAYLPRVQSIQPTAVSGGRPNAAPSAVPSNQGDFVDGLEARNSIGTSTSDLRFTDYTYDNPTQDDRYDRRRRLPEPSSPAGAGVSRAADTFSALIAAQEDHTTGDHRLDSQERVAFGIYLERGVNSYEFTHRMVSGTLVDRGNTLSLVY